MKKLLVLLMALASSAQAVQIDNQQLATYWKTPEQSAQTLVNNMTFDEKLGQIFMFDFRHWGMDDNGQKLAIVEPNQAINDIIKDYHLGSVILFRENLLNTPQVVDLVNSLQHSRSNLPLFISIDQEGGYVTRLQQGTEMPGNMALGATRSKALAEVTGMVHAYELSSLGFNFNFGPVVDVNNNQNNPVIGVRSYSDNPELVIDLARSYIDGIHKYDVMTSIKHFPGHGNVSTDTHFALPTINIDENTWRKVELKPFAALMNDADAIMTAHVVVPALDDNLLETQNNGKMGTPATLSKKILTDVLRDELGYQGIIITDAMDMGAIASNFDKNWSIKQAILAGNDIILMPLAITSSEDIELINNLYQYLAKEAQNNPELMQRINQSAERVVKAKLEKQIVADDADVLVANTRVATQLNKDLENMIAENAITVIKNDHVLPYKLNDKNRIVIYSDEKPRNDLIKKHLNEIANKFDVTMQLDDHVVKMMQNDLTEKQLVDQIKGQELVLLTTYNLSTNPANAQKIINTAKQLNVPLIVIASRNPYDIAYLDNVDANIAIYGITGFDITNNVRNSLETNIRSGLRSLFKHSNQMLNHPKGKLPVDIKTPDGSKVIYSYGHGLSY